MNTNRRRFAILLFVAGALTAACWLAPDRLAAQPPRSLDDELLDDLGADPIDDYDRTLLGEGRKQPPTDPPGETAEELRERLRRELGSAAVSEDENRMLEVARQMRQVERLMAGNDSGPDTRRLQRQIVGDLEQMIEEFRRRAEQSGSAAGAEQKLAARPAPGQPGQGGTGQNPSDRPPGGGARPDDNGPPHPADPEMVREVITRLWGELPQHEAEQMMQMLSDEYLPKYRREIEAYFRRLSEAKGW
ncbi:MAG TPA: hypothetical protein VMY42_01285 [Thermoguttaceae bacterium]|nr:hypothetical protein [Thermoguttaceae bacterium]